MQLVNRIGPRNIALWTLWNPLCQLALPISTACKLCLAIPQNLHDDPFFDLNETQDLGLSPECQSDRLEVTQVTISLTGGSLDHSITPLETIVQEQANKSWNFNELLLLLGGFPHGVVKGLPEQVPAPANWHGSASPSRCESQACSRSPRATCRKD